jgi:hypothetical protein
MMPGWIAWGGALPLFVATKWNDKKGCGWIKHQSASALAKRLERRHGWGGVCGGVSSHQFGQ